jgi:negative regulator of flagellin synthesis FlgM
LIGGIAQFFSAKSTKCRRATSTGELGQVSTFILAMVGHIGVYYVRHPISEQQTQEKIMTVKIDNSTIPLPLAPGREGKLRSPVAKSGDSALSPATIGTSVNIGTTSAHLHSMENSAANSPANPSKIAEIKQAIADGRFQINSGAVADSLIKSVTSLIASQQA